MKNIRSIDGKRVLTPYFCDYRDTGNLAEKVFAAGAFLSMLLPQSLCFVKGGAATLGVTGGITAAGALLAWVRFRYRNPDRKILCLEIDRAPRPIEADWRDKPKAS